MVAPADPTQAPPPGPRRLLMAIAVMISTVMQVLDTTIVNVALPHMQGQLSAAPDQIAWVLTSYIVASGVVMPLTGYFTDRLGQRSYLMLCIIGFVIASILCGMSRSLTQIVLFRILQGIFGAGLVPIAQSIMLQAYPGRERGRAMAVWSMGVMVGPILGPTLGGWLTDVLSWRWNFFINVPIGIIAAVIAWRVIPETPRRTRPMDWSGFLLLVCAVGGMQMVLDQGSREDWFASNEIRVLTLISAVGFIGFVWHAFTASREPVLDLRIFRDRNFAVSCLLLAVFGLGLYGTMTLLPLMLDHLFDYPATTTGLVMAPRGLASMVAMMLVGRLINRVDVRMLIIAGIMIFTLGAWITTHYNLDISPYWLVMPAIVQGVGLGMMMVPLSTVAYATLAPRFIAEATGVFSLMRTLGSAVGISVVAMLVTNTGQAAWNQLGGHLRDTSATVAVYLDSIGLTVDAPEAAAILARELMRQSQMVAYVHAFTFVTLVFLLLLPLVLLMRGGRGQAVPVESRMG